MKMRKWLVVVLSIVLIATLAACGGNNNNGNSNGGSSSPVNNNGGDGNGGGEVVKDKVTFTYFNGGASRKDVETKDTQIGKIYEDKTGVNWQIEHLVGDIQMKIGTMIAGGVFPDVIVPDTEIDNVVDNGVFIPLNDLIDKYPNIKRVYGPYLNVMKHSDGNIYFLPFGPQVGEYIASPNIDQGAFWIQARVLEEFDYPKVKTLDQYLNLIRDYVAKYPDEDLIGMTALTDDWQFFTTSNVPNHLAGYPNDGAVIIDMETMEATDYTDTEYTKRWLKALNDLNAEGLFDSTSFINNYDQYLARLTSGRVLGFFAYGWQVGTALNNLKAGGDPGIEYFPLPIVFDENIKDQYIDPPSFVDNRGIGITTSAKDPERIMEFFDFMLEEENQILNQWGIEGVTYEIDENGRYYRTPEQIEQLRNNEYSQEVGLTYFGYYWPMYSQNSTLSNGNAHAPGNQGEVALLSFTESEQKLLQQYGVNTFSEMFATPDDRPWYPAWSVALETGSAAQMFEQRKDDLIRQWFPDLVFAAPGDFENKWDSFVTEFRKLDVDIFEETITRLVKEKVEALQQ